MAEGKLEVELVEFYHKTSTPVMRGLFHHMVSMCPDVAEMKIVQHTHVLYNLFDVCKYCST